MEKFLYKEICLKKAISIQNELRDKIVMNDIKGKISLIAGVDLAYWKNKNKEYAVCCIIIVERKTKKIIDTKYSIGIIDIPYIPGCLAFRELPLILETVDKLNVNPDLYMFDGNGYLHERNMGVATHASFYLNKPTIGVAKSYYKIDNVDYVIPENKKFAYTDIIYESKVYGRVFRSHSNVKPIFLSIGNYISLETATNLVCEFITNESRIPLPTRLADIETRKIRRIKI